MYDGAEEYSDVEMEVNGQGECKKRWSSFPHTTDREARHGAARKDAKGKLVDGFASVIQ